MININSPSRHEQIPTLIDSPLYSSSLLHSNPLSSFNSFNSKSSLSSSSSYSSGNTKRPLISQHKRASVGSIYSNLSNHSHNNNHYKMNHDFAFSTLNKENIPLRHSSSNNSLYKSITYNGSPTVSRKSSIKKHMRKKSSNNIFKANQSLFGSNSHSKSKSQSHISSFNNNNTNNNNNHNHNHNQKNVQNHSNNHINLKSLSSNSIFNCLSTKPSIDSIFNFSNTHNNHEHQNDNGNHKLLGSPYPDFSRTGKNSKTGNATENDSYYLSDEDLPNTAAMDDSYEFIDSDTSDNNMMDFGSPLQKKQSSKNALASKMKHFNLQRHQSLMQFSSTNNDSIKNLNYKIDTEQLTSNINGLTVNSDDDEFNFGNSVLNESNIQFLSYDHCKVPRISVDQFKLILEEYKTKDHFGNGKFCKFFDELLILDCRFKFEYDGGHIENALNISSFAELESTFFNDEVLSKTPLEFNRNSRKLLIFHCEFSSHRGPMKADQLRYFDRSLCGDFYPNLYYPDIIVLEGGYKDYYESEKTLHKSLSYIEMDHPLYKDERERNLDLLRKESNLSRQNSRNSSSVALSRKTSHSSIKSVQSSTILDFSQGNKIETLKKRPSKRFTFSNNNNNNNNSSSIEKALSFEISSNSSTPLIRQDGGLFGGFGNHNIDLDNLVDIHGASDDDDDDVDIDDTIDKVNLGSLVEPPNTNHNDGFKIPLPRPKFNRRNSLHSRSKTVSSFTYSNHSGFKSVPLLTTPEKTEAKFGNKLLFQHSDNSFYSVKEDLEIGEEVDRLTDDFDVGKL